jgi:hypothetical protein
MAPWLWATATAGNRERTLSIWPVRREPRMKRKTGRWLSAMACRPWVRVPPPAVAHAGPAAAVRLPLSQAAIVQTALQLLDRHGLDQFSMRQVARALGTGPASLYA